MGDLRDLGSQAIERLEVSGPVKQALKDIHAELADAYREAFLVVVETLNRQASALDRIQVTLNTLVKHFDLRIDDSLSVPAVLRVAGTGDEQPDVASALVVADPIGCGYTLTQTALARALGLGQADVSILVGPFGLKSDGDLAVTVRAGNKRELVNYHPRAIARFRELVASPPRNLTKQQTSALERVKRQLITAPRQKA